MFCSINVDTGKSNRPYMIYIFTNWDYANQINDLIKEYYNLPWFIRRDIHVIRYKVQPGSVSWVKMLLLCSSLPRSEWRSPPHRSAYINTKRSRPSLTYTRSPPKPRGSTRNRAARSGNAGKCTGWRTETSGVPSVSGRRPAPDSWIEESGPSCLESAPCGQFLHFAKPWTLISRVKGNMK